MQLPNRVSGLAIAESHISAIADSVRPLKMRLSRDSKASRRPKSSGGGCGPSAQTTRSGTLLGQLA
eukprot:5621840-Alexandrium_andersonii.AAC.1